MSFLYRTQPALRTLTRPSSRLFTSTAIQKKSPTEAVKDTVKTIDRKVSDVAVGGIEKAGKHIFGVHCWSILKSYILLYHALVLVDQVSSTSMTFSFHFQNWRCFRVEQAAAKAREVAGMNAEKAKAKTEKAASEASSKAQEVKHETKGKMYEVEGKAKATAEEVKAKGKANMWSDRGELLLLGRWMATRSRSTTVYHENTLHRACGIGAGEQLKASLRHVFVHFIHSY